MRLFFALWPGPEQAETLARWARLAHGHCGGRVMRTETLHLTLAFLGRVDAELARELIAATGSRRIEPGRVMLDRYGVFRRPRILWAGPDGPHEALQALRDELWSWLGGHGLSPAEPQFQPHVTLLRNIERAEPPAPPPDPFEWRYERMALVASEPVGETGGSRYRVVAQSPA